MIAIRFMDESELVQAAAIDVSEEGNMIYECAAGELKAVE